jgi:hypothetical protein
MRFPTVVAARSREYLDDPAAMVNDFTALAFLIIAAGEESGELTTVKPYAARAESRLAEAVEQLSYEELTDKIMDAWLNLTDELDPRYQAQPETDPDERNRNLATSAILVARGGVLTNTLGALSRRDPRQFLERMYTFAQKGLDTDNMAKREVALSVLARCLSEPLAYQLMIRSTMAAPFVDMENGPAHVRQGMDLNATLDGFGVRLARHRITELTDAERQLLDEIFPAAAMIDKMHIRDSLRGSTGTPRFEVALRQFKDRALTPEGRASTLYGRLANAPEAS